MASARFLSLPSFLPPFASVRGFSPADRARNRNESQENHALRINLSLLARTLGYGMMLWYGSLVFFCPEIHRNKAVVCLYGLLAASPTGEPDIDQEQKREGVGSPQARLLVWPPMLYVRIGLKKRRLSLSASDSRPLTGLFVPPVHVERKHSCERSRLLSLLLQYLYFV